LVTKLVILVSDSLLFSKDPMTRLHHCNTHYHIDPPVDINPLILERYKTGKVLALCARQEMVKRIDTLMNTDDFYPNIHLVAYGWWDAKDMGLVDKDEPNDLQLHELLSYDAVAIICRSRIHQAFLPLMREVEDFLICESSPPEI